MDGATSLTAHQKATATEIPSLWKHNGKRHVHSDCSINRITSLLKDRLPYLACERVSTDHRGMGKGQIGGLWRRFAGKQQGQCEEWELFHCWVSCQKITGKFSNKPSLSRHPTKDQQAIIRKI